MLFHPFASSFVSVQIDQYSAHVEDNRFCCNTLKGEWREDHLITLRRRMSKSTSKSLASVLIRIGAPRSDRGSPRDRLGKDRSRSRLPSRQEDLQRPSRKGKLGPF